MAAINPDRFLVLWRQGWSFREIAESMRVPQGTVRSHAARAGLRRRASRREMLTNAARRRAEEQAPTPEDAAVSESSVLLSPWVRSRIDALGIVKHREWEIPVILR